jgi:hypothetical protein
MEQLSPLRHWMRGRVEMESEWTAGKRSGPQGDWRPPLNCPTQAKSGLEWVTRPALELPHSSQRRA